MNISKETRIIILFILIYLLVAMNYPSVIDDSIFAVIGSNLDHQTLYVNSLDNKPPAIFLTFYFLSKIPLPFFALAKFVAVLAIITTAYFTLRLFKQIFNGNNALDSGLFLMPLIFIASSVMYQGGVLALTETFEVLFLIVALNFFFDHQNKYSEEVKVILSSLFFFIAFEYKQTGIIFLGGVALYLIFQRKIKLTSLLVGSFLVFFIVSLIILSSYGILGAYLDYVWKYNFTLAGGSTSILSKIATFLFLMPLLFIAIPGILIAWKKYPEKTKILCLIILISLAIDMIFIKGLSFRIYFLEIAPLLILFVPWTFDQAKKMAKVQQAALCCIFLIPFIFFGFVLLKVSGFIGGYNLYDEKVDVDSLHQEVAKFSCDKTYATIQYWHLSQIKDPTIVTSLNWYWRFKDLEQEGRSLLSDKNCYVLYTSRPIYTFGPYVPEENADVLYGVAKKICKCENYQQKTSNSAICYDCKSSNLEPTSSK